MKEEADPKRAGSAAESAPSAAKKKKSSKTVTKKQASSSTKSKASKQKSYSGRASSKNKVELVESNDPPQTTEENVTEVQQNEEDIQPEAPSHVFEQEFVAEGAEEDGGEEGSSMEKDGEPLQQLPQAEDRLVSNTPIDTHEETKTETADGDKRPEGEASHQEGENEEPAGPTKRPASSEGAPSSPQKRPRGPPGPTSMLDYVPRTSIQGTCQGPWRSAACCTWLHDTVGCTCRQEAGGPLPDKWSAYSDFLSVVDMREVAEKKAKGALGAPSPAKEGAEAAEDEGSGQQQQQQEEQQEEQQEDSSVSFSCPNSLMVKKLLILPCKTFLSSVFSPQLVRCRPFFPIGLQEQFDGAQRRRAGLGRRPARPGLPPHKTPTGAPQQQQQQEQQQEQQQQEEQQQASPPARRPIMYGAECLLDEGRVRLLSVINLCLTERHYEPQLMRRDGLSVFWHKSQGGGEIPTTESLLLYFKLVALATMQGVRTAEHWAAAADCAVCSIGVTPSRVRDVSGLKGAEGPQASAAASSPCCKCEWRFAVVTHCTHGLNRTGYMVCALLMALLNLSAAEAQHVFSEARGYPIPRQEILDALQQLEKEGFSPALRAALEQPQLDCTYAANAEEEGINLQKGCCFVHVGEPQASTANKAKTIPIPPGLNKSLAAFTETEKKKIIRARELFHRRTPRQLQQQEKQQEKQEKQQQQQQEQQQQEQQQEEPEAETVKEEEEQVKEELSDGQREKKADGETKEEAAAAAATAAAAADAAAVLTEEEQQKLPVIPSVIPNNGIVLFGPLSNALIAPEELLIFLLDIHPNLRICDYRVLRSNDFNNSVNYPVAIPRTNGIKKRRVGVPARSLGQKQQETDKQQQQEEQQQQQQQEEEQQQQEKKEEQQQQQQEGGEKKEGVAEVCSSSSSSSSSSSKPLEFHYVLYVQTADPFSFEALVNADLVSLRKQPLQVFTSDFLPYLLERGRELDEACRRWSLKHPPRPKKIFLPIGSGLPPPPFRAPGGFGPPVPPPRILSWMGGPSRAPPPPQDMGSYGPPFGGPNGRLRGGPPGPPEGGIGRKPFGGGPPGAYGRDRGPQWNVPPCPPPPPPPQQPQMPFNGGGDAPGSRFLRVSENHQQGGGPPDALGRMDKFGRESGGPRQGPPRDFYDAVRQLHPRPQGGQQWRAQNGQGWGGPGGLQQPPAWEKGGRGGALSPMHPTKDNGMGDAWGGASSWEGQSPNGAPGGWRQQGPPGAVGGPEGSQWGTGPEGEAAGGLKHSRGSAYGGSWNSLSPTGAPRGAWEAYNSRGGVGGVPYRGASAHAFNEGGSNGMQQQQQGYNSYSSLQQQGAAGTSPTSAFHQQGFGANQQQQQQQVPEYVMQLLQQQAAQRGASVDPQVLAQLYTQYYQSFLTSMTSSPGAQQLSQDQLLQYLQQMQQQQQQPAR